MTDLITKSCEQGATRSGFREYQEFRARQGPNNAQMPAVNVTYTSGKSEILLLTPDEQIRAGYQLQRSNLAPQLLERARQSSPAFFETLVVKLLIAMGYGGSYEDAAKVVSVRRWRNRWHHQRRSAGTRKHLRASQTLGGDRRAAQYAKSLQTTIVLIDGAQLADYMIEFGVGVNELETIRLKRLDEDYFGEE